MNSSPKSMFLLALGAQKQFPASSLCRLLSAFLFIAILRAQAQEQGAAPEAATSAQPKSAPSAGVFNDWLRAQSAAFTNWDIGAQVRARFEHREHFGIVGESGSADFLDVPGIRTDNTFFLLREKVHLGYTAFSWLGGFVEARDSSTHNDRRNPNVEADTFDLHQGFVWLGDKQEFPLLAKVGRQELIYGDERLIGAFDWNNLGRVFDAAKLRCDQGDFWVDAFVGRVVLPDDRRFNRPNDYDWFSGVYASTRWVPWQVTELYFLSRNVSEGSTRQITTSTPAGGATPRDIYTLGLRVKSLPGTLNGWDYGLEVAGQFGNFATSAAGPRLDHEALATHVSGGYTWQRTFGSPRVGLGYNYASGDSDPADGKHETFENLFPTNHKFYGNMDFFSWQNMHDVRVSGSIKPLNKLAVTLDYHAFWLADTADFFYRANGVPRRTGGYGINRQAGNYVGSEVDLAGTYAFASWASAQIGYGHFFIGDYVRDTLTAARSSDADFVYLQLLAKF